MTDWLTWCEALERAKPTATEADIERAMYWYEGVTGTNPKIMALNPKNVALAVKVPEGIDLRLIGGCLAWEIWLASGEPTPAVRGYFSAARDQEVIEAGGFFCQGCLAGKPANEQSPDPRYCQSCFVFFTLEANALPAKARKPDWIPEIADKKTAGVVEDTTLIMSTLTDKKSEVDIITSRITTRPLPKRGPKHRALPLDLINQWAGEGMGSKAIAARLKGEGVEVSYKTIQRILKGERLLV